MPDKDNMTTYTPVSFLVPVLVLRPLYKDEYSLHPSMTSVQIIYDPHGYRFIIQRYPWMKQKPIVYSQNHNITNIFVSDS